MKHLPLRGRTLALLAVIVSLLAPFIYVGLRSGPRVAAEAFALYRAGLAASSGRAEPERLMENGDA